MAKVAKTPAENKKEKPQEEISIFGEKLSEKDWDKQDAGSSVWGVFFLLAGLVLLGNALQIIPWEFWNHVWQFWPVLIILLGVHIILGNNILSRVTLFILALVFFGLILIYGLEKIQSPLLEGIPADLKNFINWLESQRP